MKELMLGNAAVARGLYEAGCKVVSSYPGTPSTEITEEVAKYEEIYGEWAPNEKVAMEVAFGASLAGKRSFCAMKHVGVNVAADPLFTLSYTGVGGGLVIGVADDPGMHSSQNEQDSRHYAKASKVPMLEPADSQEAIDFTKIAFELSEKFDTPVFVKMCTRISHSQSVVQISDPIEVVTKEYKKNPAKNIMMPSFAKLKHPIVESRTLDLIEFSETTELNRIEEGNNKKIGFITSSTSYQYIKEVFGDTYSVLKLGLVYPLPTDLIKDFSKIVDEVVVVEELDPFIEEHCNNINVNVTGKDIFSLIGEFSQNIIADGISRWFASEKVSKYYSSEDAIKSLDESIPVRPPVMCAGCPHRGLFHILNKEKLTVMGDIGCYTLGAAPPLGAIDSVLCMGASISGVHGFNKAMEGTSDGDTVAVIGDSTFMHSGVTGLINIAYNQSNSTVIIVDNSITGMTGHQHNPTTGYNLKGDPATKIDLEKLCRAVGINDVVVVDPYDLKETYDAIKNARAKNEPSVIISRRPCVLLKSVKISSPINVDSDKCVGCKKCMEIGCPAISMVEKKARIDVTLCTGCDVCTQLCKFEAMCKSSR